MCPITVSLLTREMANRSLPSNGNPCCQSSKNGLVLSVHSIGFQKSLYAVQALKPSKSTKLLSMEAFAWWTSCRKKRSLHPAWRQVAIAKVALPLFCIVMGKQHCALRRVPLEQQPWVMPWGSVPLNLQLKRCLLYFHVSVKRWPNCMLSDQSSSTGGNA